MKMQAEWHLNCTVGLVELLILILPVPSASDPGSYASCESDVIHLPHTFNKVTEQPRLNVAVITS